MKKLAGTLRQRVEVLTLAETTEGWAWVKDRGTWAGVELTGKTNLFSAVGIGARTAELLLRHQPLSLFQAIRWGEQHLFLTEITEYTPGWLEVRSACVELVTCRMDGPGGVTFPAILTEKYLRHEQQTPMAVNVLCFVLVVPKVIRLTPGRLVEVQGEAHTVLVPHTLDPYKNEYEIAKTRDL